MCNKLSLTPYFKPDESLGYLATVTGRLFVAVMNRGMAGAGLPITAEQWGLIRFLMNRDGQSQDELQQATHYEKSTLSRLLDGLERKGLACRERNPRDGRSKVIRLTDAGWENGEAGTAVARAVLERVHGSVNPDELEVCRKVLRGVQPVLVDLLRGEES